MASIPSSDSLLVFPVDIVVKAMGRTEQGDNEESFESLVQSIVTPHLRGKTATVTTTTSSKANYLSVRVRFVAQDKQQLEAVYRDLHANDRVLYTL